MDGQWKEVVRLRFKGKRFRDHALDLSALSELGQFQKMVAETAKTLWRASHPARERLPRHFENRTRLCLRKIEEGSATAPLEVYIEKPDQNELWQPEPVEVTEAIDLAHEVFQAVHEEIPLPENFPKQLFSEYSKWGQTLADDETIEFSPSGKDNAPVRITSKHRERFVGLCEERHQDAVDVAGEVLEVDVRHQRFQLWIDDKTFPRVAFTDQQELEITTALRDHRTVRVHIKGRGDFSPQGILQHISAVDELQVVPAGELPFDAEAPAIEDELIELAKCFPHEDWNKLPDDFLDNLDHYLYGTPGG